MSESTGPPSGHTFDRQIADALVPHLSELFLKHPELRSVGVCFDYYGALNGVDGVNNGIWLGPEGSVKTPDGIVGSLQALMKLQNGMFERGLAMLEHLEQRLTEVSQELHDKASELHGEEEGR